LLKISSFFLKVKPAEVEEVTGAEVEVRGRLQVDLETAELPVKQKKLFLKILSFYFTIWLMIWELASNLYLEHARFL